MKPYRQWLNGKSYEAMASLGGSFRLEQYRRLLPDAVRPRLRRRSSSSITTSSAERRSRRWPPTRDARRSRWSGTARTSMRAFGSLFNGSRRHRQVHRSAAGQLRDAAVRQGAERTARRSACRRTPAITTTSARCCRWRSVNNAHSEPGTQVTVVWGEAAAERRSRPSSATRK